MKLPLEKKKKIKEKIKEMLGKLSIQNVTLIKTFFFFFTMKRVNYSILASFRAEKTPEITKSNHFC